MPPDFPEVFAELLAASGLKQREIASRAKMSETSITRMKNGTLTPSEDAARRLDEVFGSGGTLVSARQRALEKKWARQLPTTSRAALTGDFSTPIEIDSADFVMYLSGDRIEIDEVRDIRALAPNVQTIPQLAAMHTSQGATRAYEFIARYGARVIDLREPVGGYVVTNLAFAEPLPTDRTHRYQLTKYISGPVRPHYLVSPVVPWARLTMRIQFDTARLPQVIQRVEREPTHVAYNIRPGRPDLRVDRFGLVEVAPFESLAQGWSYGAVWRW